MIEVAVVAFLAVLLVVPVLFGADSRDGRDWQPTGTAERPEGR